MNIDKQIENTIKEYTIGYGCKVCGGGGSIDGNGKEVCSKCNGLGITDWEFNYCVPKIKQSILKAIMKEAPENKPHERVYDGQDFGELIDEGYGDACGDFESVIKEILQTKTNEKD